MKEFISACALGNLKAVESTLKKVSIKDILDGLIQACCGGNNEIVECITSKTKLTNKAATNCFIESVHSGNIKAAKMLAEKYEIDFTAQNNRALKFAVQQENIELINYILCHNPVCDSLISWLDKFPVNPATRDYVVQIIEAKKEKSVLECIESKQNAKVRKL